MRGDDLHGRCSTDCGANMAHRVEKGAHGFFEVLSALDVTDGVLDGFTDPKNTVVLEREEASQNLLVS